MAMAVQALAKSQLSFSEQDVVTGPDGRHYVRMGALFAPYRSVKIVHMPYVITSKRAQKPAFPNQIEEAVYVSLSTDYPQISQEIGDENIEIFRYLDELRRADGSSPAIEHYRRRIIEMNMGLVRQIAQKFMIMYQLEHNPVLQFDDLLNEGVFGLSKAFDRFEYRRGYRFSTYATCWIMQSIRRAIYDHKRTIRVPVHMQEKITRFLKNWSESRNDDKREFYEAMRDATGIDVEAFLALRPPLSLYMPLTDEQDGDVLGDVVSKDPSDLSDRKFDRIREHRSLSQLLGTLDARSRDILNMRFGLEPYDKPATLGEIGLKHGVTRERIRQLIEKNLTLLRRRAVHHKLLEKLYSA